jgi:WD40 repeat protein
VFNPAGDRLFVGGAGTLANVYDTSTYELVAPPLIGHTNDVIAAAFNADGSLLATASFDFSAIIWDTRDNSKKLVLQHTNVVTSVTFRKRLNNGDNRELIATGSWDGTAVVWDASTGRQVTAIHGPGSKVWSVAFSPDGQRLLTGSEDGVIRAYKLDGTPDGEWPQHTAATTSLSFSRDSPNLLLSTSGDTTAVVWDYQTQTPSQPLSVPNAVIWSGTFVDMQWILTADAAGNVRVWHDDAATP